MRKLTATEAAAESMIFVDGFTLQDAEELRHLQKKRMTNIYFILSVGTETVKIGRSDDISKRINQLRSSNPNKLILLAQYYADMREERYLHYQFEEDHIRGEWFRLSDRMIEFLGYINRGGENRSREFFAMLDNRNK